MVYTAGLNSYKGPNHQPGLTTKQLQQIKKSEFLTFVQKETESEAVVFMFICRQGYFYTWGCLAVCHWLSGEL